MANGHGGPRQGIEGRRYPNRTDLQFGIRKDAPIRQAPAPPQPGQPAGVALTPLDAPTQRPDEPVTAGAPVGPGPGLEALGQYRGDMDPAMFGDLEALRPYLPALEFIASQPTSTPSMRNFVRTVRGSVPFRAS